MTKILTGQTLLLENVLSYRFRVPYHMIENQIQRMDDFLKRKKVTRSGYAITATHSVEKKYDVKFVDMEVKYPLVKKIKVVAPYEFIPEFKITNALKISHEGNPRGMLITVTELMEYIKNNNLTPSTQIYNVTVREGHTLEETEKYAGRYLYWCFLMRLIYFMHVGYNISADSSCRLLIAYCIPLHRKIMRHINMNDMKTMEFAEMNDYELQNTDGGSLTAALIGGGVALFTAGFAGGIAVGLNKVNRTK